MGTSLFIVSTPAQAFFISLAPQLIGTNSILILTIKKKKEEQDILNYLKSFEWKEVHIWYLPIGDNLIGYLTILSLRLKLLRFKMNSPNIEKVFIGSYSNIYHLSLSAEFEKKSSIFLLYDGVQIISVAAMRNKGNFNLVNFPLLHRIFRFNKPELLSLTYVSPITLNLISDNDSFFLIENSIVKGSKIYEHDKGYFIGNNLPGIGIVSREFYLESLIFIKNNFPNKEIIYIPHPREDVEILPLIEKIFKIEKFDKIFEDQFVSASNFPGIVFSFCSSILLNLIFLNTKSKIFAINIPVSEIKLESYKEPITSIYKYYENIADNRFSLLNLNYK